MRCHRKACDRPTGRGFYLVYNDQTHTDPVPNKYCVACGRNIVAGSTFKYSVHDKNGVIIRSRDEQKAGSNRVTIKNESGGILAILHVDGTVRIRERNGVTVEID